LSNTSNSTKGGKSFLSYSKKGCINFIEYLSTEFLRL
jgi:hypothetical protein